MALSAKEISKIQIELESAKRELQIEAAVARVRAAAMSMHSSADLMDVVLAMRDEIVHLDLSSSVASTITVVGKGDHVKVWDLSSVTVNGKSAPMRAVLEFKAPEWDWIARMKERWDAGESYFVVEFDSQELPVIADQMVALDPESGAYFKNIVDGGHVTHLWTAVSSFSSGFLSADFVEEPEASVEDVLSKMSVAFDLAFRRFQDLENAEAQARESQVEAAVERVRSRTMAMRESSELESVVGVVFSELTSMDVELSRAIIWIFDDQEKIIHWWMANPEAEGVAASYEMPYNDYPLTQHFLKAWRDQIGDSIYVHDGKLKDEYDDYIFGKTDVGRLPLATQEGMRAPDAVYLSSSVGKFATVMVASESPISEESHDIVQRFGSTFQQTYTRFLDVQLAEAQAREAQIEAALERVRGRAMAMHASSELESVIGVILNELNQLDMELARCILWIVDEKSEMIDWWLANPEVEGNSVSYEMPFNDLPNTTYHLDAWRNKETHATYVHEGKLKVEFDDYIFGETGMSRLPLEAQEGMREPDTVYLYSSIADYGALFTPTVEPLSDESFAILQRFGKVFQQSYTRFLDVQLAETQAREAQIEVALERIRGRALAMRSSEELMDVVVELRRQIDSLGQLDLEASVVHIFTEGSDKFESIAAVRPPGEEGELVTANIFFPTDSPEVITRMMQLWESDKTEYTIEVDREMAEDWQRTMLEWAPMIADKRDGYIEETKVEGHSEWWNFADFSEGSLLLVTHSPPSSETWDVLRRTAKEFDLAYRRFKDLEKAEAQAREAQIEAALERVRGRALAMRDSAELTDIIVAIKQEINGLSDGDVWESSVFLNHSQDELRIWNIADVPDEEKERIDLAAVIYPKKADPPHPWMEEFAHSGKSYQEIILDRDGIERCLISIEHYYPDYGVELREWFETGTFDFEHTCIAAIDRGWLTLQFLTTPPRDIESVLSRMASVLSLAMNRSDELQEAESRTREAQIEAALERIRGRALAMRSSEEMIAVAEELRRQMGLLGQEDLEACAIHIYDTEGDDFESWGAIKDPEGEHAISNVIRLFPRKGVSPLEEAIRLYESDENQYVIVNEGDWAVEFFDMLKDRAPEPYEAMMKQMPPGMKPWDMKAYWSMADFAGGSIVTVTYKPADPESLDLLGRAAQVFDLAYRRFLDLKEAEEAAHEANIEVSLERVRARTIGMRDSAEWGDVLGVAFEEMRRVGFDINMSVLVQYDLETWDSDFWISGFGQDIAPVSYRTKQVDHPIFDRFVEAFQSEEDFFYISFGGEEKKIYDELLFSQEGWTDAPESLKAGVRSVPEAHVSCAKIGGGWLQVASAERLARDMEQLLLRFGSVIRLMHSRFLDLVKAEAAARESQIEASLERVRARTMAMQQSEDLEEVSIAYSEQLTELGMDNDAAMFLMNDPEENSWTLWSGYSTVHPLERMRGKSFKIELPEVEQDPTIDAWRSGGTHRETFISREDLPEWVETYKGIWEITGQTAKEIIDPLPDGYHRIDAFFKHGLFAAGRAYRFTEEEIQIQIRFAREFERSYLRFLDLKKAEAQAREAQFEVALERVRSRSMAMHGSDELMDVAQVLFQQLVELGLDPDIFETCGFVIFQEGTKIGDTYLTQLDGSPFAYAFSAKYGGDRATAEHYASWKEGRPMTMVHLDGPQLPEHLDYLTEMSGKPINQFHEAAGKEVPPGSYNYQANFRHGYVSVITTEPQEEAESLYPRFAKVFEQAYTRFLDLEKAEAQAREAQIEASLERVRAAAMAMHDSEGISQVTQVVFEQMSELGITGLRRASLNVVDFDRRVIRTWNSSRDDRPGMSELLIPFDKTKVSWEFVEGFQREGQRNEWHGTGDKLHGLVEELEDSGFVYEDEEDRPQDLFVSQSKFSKGTINAVTYESLPDGDWEVLDRIAQAFDLAYTRYEDLISAESAAREAQIEASLERVRAAAMAMQKSEELSIVSNTITQQLVELGLKIHHGYVFIFRQGSDDVELHVTKSIHHPIERVRGKSVVIKMQRAGFEHIYPDSDFLFSKSVDERWVENTVTPELYPGWAAILSPYFEEMGYTSEEYRSHFDGDLTMIDASTGHGVIGMGGTDGFSEADCQILSRFAAEFRNAYTRFQDIQRAEAQTREAQIEAALERVRARAMAMHKSDELLEVAEVIWDQLEDLEVGSKEWLMLTEMDRPNGTFVGYIKQPQYEGEEIVGYSTVAMDRSLTKWSYVRHIVESIENGDKIVETTVEGEWMQEFKDGLAESAIRGLIAEHDIKTLFHNFAHYSNGSIALGSLEPIPEETNQVLVRFAGAFELAYQRFEDLKKAESQAREAQIEAALERVRSRAMAMQKPEDLGDVSILMFDEMEGLGIDSLRSGISLPDADDRYEFHAATKKSDGSTTIVIGSESVDVHPIIRRAYDGWKKQEEYQHTILEGDDLVEYYHAVFDTMPLPDWKERMKKGAEAKEEFATFPFTDGWLYSFSRDDFSDEQFDIYGRFAKVFGLTYQRYHDLKTAEAQARESQIEAALERIRSRAMAMTTSNELLEVVMTIHQEFSGLDLECGIFWHAKYTSQGYEKALTGVGGTKVTTIMELPRDFSKVPELATWERGTEKLGVFKFDADSAVDYLNHMISKGNFLEVDPNAITEEAVRENHGWTFVQARTTHGEIGFTLWGETDPSEEAKDVLIRFAGAFDLAYTRFEDIQKAEEDLVRLKEEKARTESALKDLQSTQEQLIEQEKLASLGSLTAGIAHEIKNPLNFVNNFAEVSVEMAEELKEAAASGDTEEVASIVQELMDNAEQIAKHGKRADSIVKSMMQHARGGASTVEEVDFNEYVDEYAGLAWHGMRARDHGFQAEVEKNLDPAIGKANIQPQEFGRVLLNLFNNAFDAAKDVEDACVVVTTRLEEGSIVLTVSDNGPGVPEDIREKIFEPFFTTKATGEGTGLGLSLSYDIITKVHGGTMTVGSSEQGGAEFTITLPGGNA